MSGRNTRGSTGTYTRYVAMMDAAVREAEVCAEIASATSESRDEAMAEHYADLRAQGVPVDMAFARA